MTRWQMIAAGLAGLAFAPWCGCATMEPGGEATDLGSLVRPERAAEMDAFDVFVGAWDFKAEMMEVEGPNRMWTGLAEWKYSLDGRCLIGAMSLSNPQTQYQSEGHWTWNPGKQRYEFAIYNDWG